MTRAEALRAMGLDTDATEAAIKRRYQQLAFGVDGKAGMHPDKGGSAETFSVLTQVYRVARSQPVPRKAARRTVRRDTVADVLEIAATISDVLEKPKLSALLRKALLDLESKG